MNFQLIEIDTITRRSYTGDVHDLTVEEDHSYTIDGIVVHNSGGACTTRIKTGVGYPQLSAVIECADAAHGLGGHIIADGGCTCPGDVAKAFGAGADFVMLGSMFAGHYETGTAFYGMSSKTAQNIHGTGLKEYRASEGRTVEVAAKGPIADIVQEILGGIRSACTYVGAATLKELPKCTTFIRVNNQYNRIHENNTTGD